MFKALLSSLAMMCLFACTSNTAGDENTEHRRLSISEFTQLYANQIRAEEPSALVTTTADSVRVQNGDVDFIWHPNNAYREYQSYPETLDELLARHLATAREHWKTDQEFGSETVLACVRARISVQPDDDPRKRISGAPIAGDLVRYFCGDTESGIAILNEGHVAELRESDPAFDANAVTNVLKLSGPVKFEPTAKMTLVASGGNYESSLILVPEIWETLIKRHGNDLAFVLPARDLFLVAASSDADGIARMRSSAKEFYGKSAYAISPLIYRYYKGEISVLSP